MKLPSILKIPNHKKFNIEPRYYDPIKEDIENRTERIKKELEIRKSLNEDLDGFTSSIEGSFSKKSIYKESKSGLLRFLLMVILFFGAIGYLYYGNIALYLFLGSLLLIFFMRRRHIF